MRLRVQSKSSAGHNWRDACATTLRFVESLLSLLRMRWNPEHANCGLARPSAFAKATVDRSDTLSTSEGEERGDGVRSFIQSNTKRHRHDNKS